MLTMDGRTHTRPDTRQWQSFCSIQKIKIHISNSIPFKSCCPSSLVYFFFSAGLFERFDNIRKHSIGGGRSSNKSNNSPSHRAKQIAQSMRNVHNKDLEARIPQLTHSIVRADVYARMCAMLLIVCQPNRQHSHNHFFSLYSHFHQDRKQCSCR